MKRNLSRLTNKVKVVIMQNDGTLYGVLLLINIQITLFTVWSGRVKKHLTDLINWSKYYDLRLCVCSWYNCGMIVTLKIQIRRPGSPGGTYNALRLLIGWWGDTLPTFPPSRRLQRLDLGAHGMRLWYRAPQKWVPGPRCGSWRTYWVHDSIYLPRRDGRLSWPRLPGNRMARSRTGDHMSDAPTTILQWAFTESSL